jgi:predicted dithiol-disulfide oxidoreductase (DUF899 family)
MQHNTVSSEEWLEARQELLKAGNEVAHPRDKGAE